MNDARIRGSTPQERFDRSLGNKLWRLCNLYTITTRDGRRVKFRPNFVQRTILRALRVFCDRFWNPVDPIRDITIKYRQGGVSTLFLLWWLDEAIFRPNTTVGIMAHKQDSINYLFELIRSAHESMPQEYRPELGSDSKTELTFPAIGSKIMVALEFRSTAIHALHISEHCLIKNEKIAASISAVPPMSGHITSESTGHGVGNHGYNTYQEAKAKTGRWRGRFVPWYIQREYRIPKPEGTEPLVPSTDEKRFIELARTEWNFTIDESQILFRRDKQKDLKKMFPEEFPETDQDAFLATGSPYFDNFKIMALLDEAKANAVPIKSEYEWRMWKLPAKGHRYGAGADTVDEGEDNAALKIYDATTLEEVFVWKGRVSASRFAEICDHWGRFYNNALLGVEDNNMGIAVLLKLNEILKYPNLYWREKTKNRTRIRRSGQVTQSETGKSKGKLGWHTDLKTKPAMLEQYKSAVEGEWDDGPDDFEPDFILRDEWLLQEALVFTNEDGKLEAQSGAHDDVVIASAIGWQMVLQLGCGSRRGAESSEKIRVGSRRQTAGKVGAESRIPGDDD